MLMLESRSRTIFRVVVYRIIAILVTAAFTGWTTAVLLNTVMIAVHYALERLWVYAFDYKDRWSVVKTPWGRQSRIQKNLRS